MATIIMDTDSIITVITIIIIIIITNSIEIMAIIATTTIRKARIIRPKETISGEKTTK